MLWDWVTLGVNYGFPRITKKVPSVLVALVVGTGRPWSRVWVFPPLKPEDPLG